MRKTILLLASVALAVLVASGVAWAATIQGTGGDDELTGTDLADVIIPYGGNDKVYALGGNDEVRHSFGNDYILGGSGNDTLRGGFDNDHIWGGPGKDLIDCAYVKSRDKGEAWDVAHVNEEEYKRGDDRVVDCKEIRFDDTTNDTTRISSIDATGSPTLTQ